MAAVLDALALSAGAAAALNPCGVGLLPTYLAFLLDRPPPRAWPTAALEGTAAGAAMTLGLLIPFALLAATFGSVAGWIGPHLSTIGALLGLAVAAWGALLLAGRDRFALFVPVRAPALTSRGPLALVAYGVVFALVSLGCTFPVFLSLLLQATTAGGAAAGASVVLVYALGMGAVATALAVAARLAHAAARRLAARAAALSHRLAGAVMVLSGLFVAAYFLFGLALG